MSTLPIERLFDEQYHYVGYTHLYVVLMFTIGPECDVDHLCLQEWLPSESVVWAILTRLALVGLRIRSFSLTLADDTDRELAQMQRIPYPDLSRLRS